MASALMILFLVSTVHIAAPRSSNEKGENQEAENQIERTGPAGPQQPDPPTTEPAGEGGIDMTQSGTTPAPTRPGSTPGLVTESRGTKSMSTPPDTEETSAAGPQWPDPPTREPAGEGEADMTQSGTTPAPTHPGSTPGPVPESSGTKSMSTPPRRDVGSIPLVGTTMTPQLGENPAGTCPCNTSGAGTESGDMKATSTPPGKASDLTSPIIAGVSAVAIGFLLLLLAFVCYRRTRGREGPVLGQSRESEGATTVYTLVGEPKQADVPPQAPDPGAEGPTYTELDVRALQEKQGVPAPAPVLYSTINVSQGPEGQGPQDAGAPPPP